MRGETTIGDDDRGQSDVLGVALITALVVVGTVGIVALGSGVLADGRSDAQIESAEQAMTKLDATAALVALGRSDTQRATVSLRGIDEQLRVDPEEGWMNVTIVDRSTGEWKSTVMNRTLGTITYKNGDTKIAYQGGGVWKQVDGGSVMVSPPEFHYRGNTLTLPLITVENTGDGVYSGDVVLKSTGIRDQRFPDPPKYTNPLPEKKQVNVTVHSEYYDAWGRFFAQRTDGEVTYDHENETVVVELVVPEEFPFSAAVIGTDPGGIDANGCTAGTGGDQEPCNEFYTYNSEYPSADDKIEGLIEDCQDGDISCDTRDPSDVNNLDGGDTFYYESGLNADNITVDTTSGDVVLVVNGDADLKNVNVDGSNSVKLYVNGTVSIGGGGEINWEEDNSADQFITYIHSSGEFDWNGKAFLKGLIYAPGAHGDINGQGNGEFVGSIVIETGDLNGLPAQTYTFPGTFELGLGGPDLAYVNYLYVSTIELEVNGTG